MNDGEDEVERVAANGDEKVNGFDVVEYAAEEEVNADDVGNVDDVVNADDAVEYVDDAVEYVDGEERRDCVN